MNRIANNRGRRGLPRVLRVAGGRGQQSWPSRRMAAWPALVALLVSVALVAAGCKGGEEKPAAPAEPAAPAGPSPGAMPSAPPAAKPKEKEKEKEPLPEDISAWQTEEYYRAKKEGEPRLIEAVALLGKQFAGTPKADSAAQLLTNLLKKSEEPEPKPGPKQASGYPGMPSSGYPGMSPEGGMPPDGGMMPGGPSGDSYMPPEASMGPGMPGMPGMPSPGAAGPGRAPNRLSPSDPELVGGIVDALGVNNSDIAKKTLTQVVEGKFETDNNRVATLASLGTFVAHPCKEYEDMLVRCLTEPEKLRELGKSGQAGQPGYPGSTPNYMEEPSGYPGPSGYPTPGGYPGMSGQSRGGSAPLTAEELQKNAFALIRPYASPELRVQLAKHLAEPTSPREDQQLFGPYLREANPENVGAQIVLYSAQGIDAQTKEVIEDNFIEFSSDALAGVLGMPPEERDRASRRSRRKQGQGPGGMYPGYPGGPEGSGMMPGGEPAMGPSGYDASMQPGGPGPAPADASGHPSRYGGAAGPGGRPSARPSRYGGGQPGAARQPEPQFQPTDPDLPYRLAQQMWAPAMTKLVEARLGQVASLEKEAPLILLASTIPVDSTRMALQQALQRHWQDGPGPLEAAGLLDDVVSDPAFLASVKMLPRKEAEEKTQPVRPGLGRSRTGRRGYGQPGAEAPGAAPPSGMEPGAMEPSGMPGEGYMQPGARPGATARRQLPKEPDRAWMVISEDLLRTVCERLLAAGRATGAEAGEGMPVEIRDDGQVVAEYHVEWPPTQEPKLAGVPFGPMKLYYVRAEYQTKLSTLESYYKRQLGGVDVRDIENGSWIDSVRPVPDSDWKRSIDLLFTATVPADAEFDKKAEVPITLDVLCIDIKSPAPAAAGN